MIKDGKVVVLDRYSYAEVIVLRQSLILSFASRDIPVSYHFLLTTWFPVPLYSTSELYCFMYVGSILYLHY